MYGSQRMKDWQEVIKLYERESMYLAEAAQILTRNITYEIPSLKKQITKFEQLSIESEKKILDLAKSENILKSEHLLLCQQLGIKGEKIRRELVQRLDELPKIYQRIASGVPSLNKSIDLYSEFSGNLNSLELLRHVASNGNTTVYQFLYSEEPLSIEQPELKINLDLDDEKIQETGEIDYGAEEEIDFGGAEPNLEVGDIDWGEPNLDADNSDPIDFSISLEESGIVVESGGQSGGIAKGDEAYTILDSPVYRDQFINDLMELEAFLKMRLYELTTTDKSRMISMTNFDGFSGHDSKSISEMLSDVVVVLSQLTEQLIQHLHQVKHSPKYVDILAGKLQHKLLAVDKIKISVRVCQEKTVNYKKDSVALKPVLDRVIDQTKILQEQIQSDISKRYKNRIVNLMGGINTI